MTAIERIKKAISDTKVVVVANKKVVIASFGALIVTTLATVNINLIQTVFYKLNDQTTEIVALLDAQVLNEKNQERWFFEIGMDHILDHLEEEGQTFINSHFEAFNQELQLQILEAYNKNKLLLTNNTKIIGDIAKGAEDNAYRQYIQRIDIETFERDLAGYFGKAPEVTQDIVNELYKVLQMKNERLPLKLFDLNIYELMSFPHNGDSNSIAIKLLGYFEPEEVKKKLFSALKVQPIEVDLLHVWVEVLSKENIITTQEYAGFKNNYDGIKRVREENKNIQSQEVDLLNVKETIEIETDVLFAEQEKIQKEIDELEKMIPTKEKELREYTNYKSVDVYILDQYPDGEYEAAVPERSWLMGTYKPGDHRMRIKTTRTQIEQLGIHTLDVYVRGKTSNGLPYYVEVSNQDREMIAAMQNEISGYKAEVDTKNKAIESLEQEIDQIRKANNYQQTIELIEEMERKKEQIQTDLNTYQVEIQNLFGIGDVIVSL